MKFLRYIEQRSANYTHSWFSTFSVWEYFIFGILNQSCTFWGNHLSKILSKHLYSVVTYFATLHIAWSLWPNARQKGDNRCNCRQILMKQKSKQTLTNPNSFFLRHDKNCCDMLWKFLMCDLPTTSLPLCRTMNK